MDRSKGGWAPTIGAALLITSGPSHDPNRKHLHVIVTKIADDGAVVLIPIISTTGGARDDDACELKPGDHPFVTKPCFAFYERAQVWETAVLQAMMEAGECVLKPPASKSLLSRIIDGAAASRRIDRRMKALIAKVADPPPR